MMKRYLGDGVYAELEIEIGTVKLTTEDGIRASNTIYLGDDELKALIKFYNDAVAYVQKLCEATEKI